MRFKMKTKLLLLTLFNLVICDDEKKFNDPFVFDAKLFTYNGDHSFPMFSDDGRFVYYTAKGDKLYKTKCEHVYQVDLSDEISTFPSLYSSGIGYEARTIAYKRGKDIDYENSIVSTSFGALQNLYKNPLQDFDNDFFCPKSKCDQPTNADVKTACSIDHIEHPDHTAMLRVNKISQRRELTFYAQDSNTWVNPEIRFGAQKLFSGHRYYGESFYWREDTSDESVKAKFDGDGNGSFDGFNALFLSSQSNPNNYTFFHGYKNANQATINAIKEGVVPLKGAKIYRTTFDQIKNGNQDPDKFVPDSSDITFVFPQPTNDPNRVLATGIDPNGKKAIYILEKDKNPVQITDPIVNSYHPALDPTNKYIAFISDRDKLGNQLYIGKFNDKNIPKPVYQIIPPTNYIEDTAISVSTYLGYTKPTQNMISTFAWAKINGQGVLMYTGAETITNCPQIYQVDSKQKDTSFHRKLSSGYHAYTSPNWIDNGTEWGTILFAATLTREYSQEINCQIEVCTYLNRRNETIDFLCERVIKEKSLPKDNELYIANRFGGIKRRLTKNTVFDGEASVSPSSRFVVYSSFIDNDYELFKMEVNGSADSKRLTNTLGFEGGVSFSSDEKYIVYYGTRPQTNDEKQRYKWMGEYELTDIGKTEIYLYWFDAQKEFKLTNLKMSSHSPVFLKGQNRIVFVANDYNLQHENYIYGIDFSTKGTNSLTINYVKKIDKLTNPIWDLYLNENTLAFVKYDDVCISQNFYPKFSNSFKYNASIILTLICFAIAKFL